jgi:hypothetical protein
MPGQQWLTSVKHDVNSSHVVLFHVFGDTPRG